MKSISTKNSACCPDLSLPPTTFIYLCMFRGITIHFSSIAAHEIYHAALLDTKSETFETKGGRIVNSQWENGVIKRRSVGQMETRKLKKRSLPRDGFLCQVFDISFLASISGSSLIFFGGTTMNYARDICKFLNVRSQLRKWPDRLPEIRERSSERFIIKDTVHDKKD